LPDHIVPRNSSLAMGASVGAGAAMFFGGPEVKAEQMVAAKEGETLIYRSASGTPASMTPRVKDAGGLSATNSLENALPGKNQIIDTSKLTNLCAVCDNLATGHVSIYPKNPSLMEGWINSRGGDVTHPLTQELMDAVVGTVHK